MNSENIAQQILQYVFSEDYRPSKPKGILKGLKLPEDSYRDLRRAIKKLVREGRVVFGSNHLILRPTTVPAHLKPLDKKTEPSSEKGDSPAPQPNRRPELGEFVSLGVSASPDRDELVDDDESWDPVDLEDEQRSVGVGSASAKELVGIYRAAPNHNYGFVKVPKTEVSNRTDEVFIPPRFTKSAMEGDTVKVRIMSSSSERMDGRVTEIVERGKREFAATFEVVDGQAMAWLDGAHLPHAVHIGDVRGLPVNNSDKIIVELVRYPDHFQPGEAVILKVLGSNKNPAVDTAAVMHQFGLVEEFPEAAVDVARRQADAFNEDEIPAGRTDLTKVPTITIDPFDARDFDDAISLSKNEKGNWELQVHIADVSHFVPVDSALDEEAQKRATSVYLPDRVIPMIPELISNHLASLQPDRNRLAKTVFMEYSPEGTLIHTRVFNSVIRNQHRFNYEQIDQYIENAEPWREKLNPIFFQIVADMFELSMLLRKLRNEKGALELTLPEVKIDLDKAGKVKGAHLVHHTQSHQMIEEFMLAANQAVAFWLDSLELPFLRRAHAPPNRLKLRQLNQFVRALGIEAGNLENRFEIQRVVDEVKGQPTEYAVNLAILKSMSKAIYQAAPERHYALDMTHYCHFTSPIRRYPDLVVHRIVQKLLDGQPAKENEMILERLGEHCSSKEQNAESAERELIKVKLLHFLTKRKGELLTGVVAGVKSTGLIVRAVEVPIDGLIPLGSLPADRYRFDRETHTLEGYRSGNRFRLGDELIVRVDKIDLIRRQLQFQLEKVTHSSGGRPAKSGRSFKSAGKEDSRRSMSNRKIENLDKFKRTKTGKRKKR